MRSRLSGKHNIDSVFILGILIVFAIGSLACIICASRIYTKTAESSQASNDARTAAAYISEKIHQNDVSGAISLGTLDGQKTLQLQQEIDGKKYVTYIYYYKGYLRELFASREFDASAKDGDQVLPLKSLAIEKTDNNLYTISCTSLDGIREELTVAARSR